MTNDAMPIKIILLILFSWLLVSCCSVDSVRVFDQQQAATLLRQYYIVPPKHLPTTTHKPSAPSH